MDEQYMYTGLQNYRSAWSRTTNMPLQHIVTLCLLGKRTPVPTIYGADYLPLARPCTYQLDDAVPTIERCSLCD